ncbi:MAG: RDD family protein [Eubacteriales bacterium]
MNKYDTFTRRFAALFIDGLIINIFVKLITLSFTSIPSIINLLLTFITANLPYVYSIYLLGRFGQTIGKIITKVKVVDNISESKIGFNQAFMRDVVPLTIVNLALILTLIIVSGEDLSKYEFSKLGKVLLGLPSTMLLIWSILEIITMINSVKNRALHDKIADTVVIRTDV